MITADFYSELASILPEERLKTNVDTKHILGNGGKVSVLPQSEEEISKLLSYANSNRKTISVMGGGTKRGFGGLTESADILLSLENYKGIVEHVAGDMTLTVKAGTTFKELQDYLEPFNQKVALDPSWPENATIGGIIAANESGPKRLGYGSSRDVVIGLRIVYPDGSIIRAGGKTVKNVAGYDMNKLFIGSMGTLGVLSEVTLKLRPIPKYESLVLLSFQEIDDAKTFAIKLLDSMMEPITLEVLSPTLSERLIGKKLHTIAISFEDVESSVHYQEAFIQQLKPTNAGVEILEQESAKTFWKRFYTISPNGAIQNTSHETEASLKVGVVNLDVLQVIRQCEILRDSQNVLIEAHGGLAHGLCQVIIKGSKSDVLSAINDMRSFVKSIEGYVVLKHLPLELRQKIEVWGETPAHQFILEGIKSKVDGNRILNPKRFVGGI